MGQRLKKMTTIASDPLMQASTKRRFVTALVRWVFKLLARVEVIGLVNVPSSGSAILAMNHMSRIDPALVAVVVKRADVSALIADTYQQFLPIRWLVDIMGGIWINRQDADLHALRQALDLLGRGGLLGIAPEGTRSQQGCLIQAHTGIAYLADKSGAPIIPAAITGSEVAFKELRHLRRPKLKLVFGKPIWLPRINRKNREQELQKNTDEIMCHIAALLPPAYWGVYHDHPRLKAILSQSENQVIPSS